MRVRRKRIETLVSDILSKQKVGEPPVPVEAIAADLGLQVKRQGLESDISGFLFRDGASSLIGVNSAQVEVRQRFTIAHEIGHFLLHQGESLHVDRSFRTMLRSGLSSQGIDVEEIEANVFAAELLMPRYLIRQDLSDMDAIDLFDESIIRSLANRYNVSAQAFLLRLTNLGYLPT